MLINDIEEKFGLIVVVEENIFNNVGEAFVQKLSTELSVLPSDLIKILTASSNEQLMNSMLKLEFGTQSRWLLNSNLALNGPKFIPVLSWLSVLSDYYQVSIIIICDIMALSFLRQDTCLLEITPLIVRKTIVLSLGDDGMIYRMFSSDPNYIPGLKSLVPENSKIIIDDLCEEIQVNDEVMYPFDPSFHENEIEITEHELEEQNESSVEIKNTQNFVKNISVDKFLETFDKSRVSSFESYSNDYSIDYDISDVRCRYKKIIKMDTTKDIDGFFSLISPNQLHELVDSDGIINNSIKKLISKREYNSFKKLITDSGNTIEAPLNIVKFGDVKAKKNLQIFAIVETTSSINLIEILGKAHQYANSFPCSNQPSPCPYKSLHRSTRSGRPNNTSQISDPKYEWEYGKECFKCLLKAMVEYVSRQTASFEKCKLYYSIRIIGSKFSSLRENSADVSVMVKDFLTPLNFGMFYRHNGPRAFLDISWKHHPTDPLEAAKLGAFWKGSSFGSSLHRKLSHYSQLFAHDLSNVHSNTTDGNIKKVNIYNGLVDLLQRNLSSKIIENLDLVEGISKAFEKLPNEKHFIKQIDLITSKFKSKIEELNNNIDGLSDTEVALRAEFRVDIRNVTSIIPLIEHMFSDHFVLKSCIILKMETIQKLTKFWVNFVSIPILYSLRHVKAITMPGFKTNAVPIQSTLPTLSAFESLLCFTLFAGTTHAVLSKLLWTNTVEPGLDKFYLKSSIKKLNRINFTGPSWNSSMGMICSTSDLLDILTKSYNLKEGAITFEALRIVQLLKSESNYHIIAKILWNNYHDVLWRKGPEDFTERTGSSDDFKIARLKPRLRGPLRPGMDMSAYSNLVLDEDGKTPAEAVKMIFNPSLIKDEKSVWKLPYLLAYNELTQDQKRKKQIDVSLEEYAAEHIEYIHNASKSDRFFTHGVHHSYIRVRIKAKAKSDIAEIDESLFMDINSVIEQPTEKKTEEKQKEFSFYKDSVKITLKPSDGERSKEFFPNYYDIHVDDAPFIAHPAKKSKHVHKLTTDGRNMRYEKIDKPVNSERRIMRAAHGDDVNQESRVSWSELEKIHACVGHNIFKEKKQMKYVLTLACEELCFRDGHESGGKIRTNDDLRYFFKRNRQNGNIIEDSEGNLYLRDAVHEIKALEERARMIIHKSSDSISVTRKAKIKKEEPLIEARSQPSIKNFFFNMKNSISSRDIVQRQASPSLIIRNNYSDCSASNNEYLTDGDSVSNLIPSPKKVSPRSPKKSEMLSPRTIDSTVVPMDRESRIERIPTDDEKEKSSLTDSKNFEMIRLNSKQLKIKPFLPVTPNNSQMTNAVQLKTQLSPMSPSSPARVHRLQIEDQEQPGFDEFFKEFLVNEFKDDEKSLLTENIDIQQSPLINDNFNLVSDNEEGRSEEEKLRRVTEITSTVFPNNTAAYVKALLKFPHYSLENDKKMTLSRFHNNHMSSSLRGMNEWKKLIDKLEHVGLFISRGNYKYRNY